MQKLSRPDRTTAIGQSIDAYLKGDVDHEDHVVHLLFSANRWEAAKQIRSDIEAGVTLVVDRYYYSGIVYSAAKDNPDLSLEWAREPEVGLPRPDLCIFLDIAPEVAALRGGYGDEKYETSKMQVRVRELFHQLRSQPGGEEIALIDASRLADDVQRDIQRAVVTTLEHQKMALPLRRLLPWSAQNKS